MAIMDPITLTAFTPENIFLSISPANMSQDVLVSVEQMMDNGYVASWPGAAPPSSSPADSWSVDYNNNTSSAQSENNSFENQSTPKLPIDMQFNEGHRLAIIIYSLLMVISAVGNVTVFTAIVRLRIKGRLSRINLFLLHLAIADLLVTFLMMPLEIGWAATVSWRAGDLMCRVMSFFRIFGLYLSGFVLVCISLDRYFAILKPLAIPDANSRGRLMLLVAWLASILCSLPQPFIFHVESHPNFQWYQQCVTFHSFPSPEFELAYNFFGFIFLYWLPLIMITFCYTRIIYEIYRINALKRNEDEHLRRSNMGALGRAKIRTLKMTIIIVATFFFCWTPYNVMSLWYWFDRKSALEVDQRIQKGLFLFACTNSCVNPLIYGLFHFRPRKRGSAPRSVPNGYRPPLQSENYKMRVRWRPNQCCVAGCGSSGNSDSTPVGSATARGRGENTQKIQIRPTQQFCLRENSNSARNCCSSMTAEHSRRDITITNGNGQPIGTTTSCRPYTQRLHGGFPLVDLKQSSSVFVRGYTPASVRNGATKTHYIDDKNNKKPYVSSLL